MRIKTFLNIAIVLLLLMANNACNDDLTTVGGSMRPPGDSIFVAVDSVQLTARTQKVESIYALASDGMVGEYTDRLLGKVKYDYMCQLYTSDSTIFHPKAFKIDSVWVRLYFPKDSIIGSKETPIGLSAYKVKNQLVKNHNTNFDVSDYADYSTPLGTTLISAKDLSVKDDYFAGTYLKVANIQTDTMLGHEIFTKWKTIPRFFSSAGPEGFRAYFPGVYVTSTFGSESLYPVYKTALVIKYKYWGRNKANTLDSAHVYNLRMWASTDVYQMNRVENTIPASLIDVAQNDEQTYISSPSGLYTELSLPILDIKNILDKTGGRKLLNSALFNLVANRLEEQKKSDMVAPRELLLIRKEELTDFFTKSSGNLESLGKSRALLQRTGATNTYSFVTLMNGYNPNLSELVNHYVNAYRKKPSDFPDGTVKLMVVPVKTMKTVYDRDYVITLSAHNLMRPTFSVIRTTPEHMKLKFIYSEIK